MSVWNYGIEKKCWFRINDGDGDGSEDTSCSLPQLFLKNCLFYSIIEIRRTVENCFLLFSILLVV